MNFKVGGFGRPIAPFDLGLVDRADCIGGIVDNGVGGSPEAFGKMIADETAKWGKAVKFAKGREKPGYGGKPSKVS